MGSCACTEKSAPDNVTAAATSSDIRGRAFSAILILHPFIASSPVRQNEPTHRAFEADDTSDLVSARKPRCERDARWDRARCREGPRTEWAPHNRTVYFALCPACSAFMGGGGMRSCLSWAGRRPDPQHDEYRASPYHPVMRARCRRRRAPRSCRQLFGDTRGEQLTI